MDYKEYSKLRSIARKRIERASAAGVTEYVKIPTVAEVRASANPAEYMSKLREFLSTPKATLRDVRTEGISFPKLEFTPVPPLTVLSPEAKKARRREQKRRSKAKRYVESLAKDEKQRQYHVAYLKAMETVAKEWRSKGVDIGNWLGVLSPKKAKAFADYMEYRFSQGDYAVQYVIDRFIRDFGELVKREYDFSDIEGDFDAFLLKQKKLKKNKKNTNKYGISEDEVNSLWKNFVKAAGSIKK